MATIFIHHHHTDVLAAEILAGALVSVGTVALVSWPAGPQRIQTTGSGEHVENIIVWTASAAACANIDGLLRGFITRRSHFIMLAHGDAEEPLDLGRGVIAPLFSRSTPWTAYREAVRALVVGRMVPDRPAPAQAPRRRVEFKLPDIAPIQRRHENFPIIPVIVLGGITLWVMFR